MNIEERKSQLKDRISLGLNVGLKSLSEVLKGDSIHRNELMSYLSQYNDLNRIASQNILDYAQIEIGFNKIRNGLFVLIDNLSEKDMSVEENLTSPKNNELIHRKNNFFKLLEIHLENVEQIDVSYSSTNNRPLIVGGRKAIDSVYTDEFQYGFKNPRSKHDFTAGNIEEFTHYFFSYQLKKFEVYFNTFQFILEYIDEEEMEKDFFLGVLRSILSSSEKALIFYFGLSRMDPEFTDIVVKTRFFKKSLSRVLMDESHFDMLK